MACTVHGEPSGSKWQEVRNFFASLSLLGDLACDMGSALLRVLTLLASPDDGEGSGWAGRVGAADIALFLVCALAALAGITLSPVTGTVKFLIKCERIE